MDPLAIRLSENFKLADFLGNHSVYARGVANEYAGYVDDQKLRNARALCEYLLEPLLSRMGPMSVSYGYISPSFSRSTVTYQDPDKPSHHRWDLGAAADVCVHRWVDGSVRNETEAGRGHPHSVEAPIFLAHDIDESGYPYSRIITYSESPYLCVAVSADEVEQGRPNKAFYENRYQGVPGSKPEYIRMPTARARKANLSYLLAHGLEHEWQGAGYPTYHGGGARRLQHIRTSRYTMMLDWLFDLHSISTGALNFPPMKDDRVLDTFLAAGALFDHLQDSCGLPRLRIVGGFKARSHPNYDASCAWGSSSFSFQLDSSVSSVELAERVAACLPDFVRIGWKDQTVSLLSPLQSLLEWAGIGDV